ncbi:MAG: phosphatidate cytidylyltransferase [Defluviitaleaceae bacterium]|nr:phosphatidate cytidylyltransferase [Defluviitaleaceae bacterium]
MIKRVLTTIIGLPLVLLVVHMGGVLLLAACGLLALTGLRELYSAISKGDKPIHWVGYAFTVVYFCVVYFFGVGQLLLIALTFFIIVVQTCLVIFFNKLPLADVIAVVYGFLYVPFLLSFIVLVREHEMGQYYVWLIFATAFGTDTFAYLAGVTLGKHKLVGTPSPSKSVEGIIGGVLGAALVGFLYGFFISRFAVDAPEYIMLIAVLIAVAGAFFCVVGDMAASAIKRRTEIKDFGNVFPGHGGVLDRLDSIMMVAPVVYMVMTVMIWMLL